jgi:hypothetical protein
MCELYDRLIISGCQHGTDYSMILDVTTAAAAVPEPSSWVLLSLVLVGTALVASNGWRYPRSRLEKLRSPHPDQLSTCSAM